MAKGVEGMTCEEQLRIPALVNPEKRLRGDLIAVYNFFKMGGRNGDADLFSWVSWVVGCEGMA